MLQPLKNLVKGLKARAYVLTGQRPWTLGYAEHKMKVIRDILADRRQLALFSDQAGLPRGFGFRLDERVIELPWVIARLGRSAEGLLDAGSALNHRYILSLPVFAAKKITIMTLAPENELKKPPITYVYGDLRRTGLASEAFDEIVCLSTLEHVGMDNTLFYTQDPGLKEANTEGYKLVVTELRRLLKPGGKLWITVPFGRYENHGWLQQFDRRMVRSVVELFAGRAARDAYFRYLPDGWQAADAADCEECRYFDLRKQGDYDADRAAAARAVACLELVK